MKLIVAITTRNRADSLKKCLRSLTKQTVKSFDVLIVDNNSNDNTGDVINSFRKQLRIKSVIEKRVGRAPARNRVLKEAVGDILATIDHDCEAFPDWIEKIIDSHKRHPKTLAIQGWAISLPRKSAISIIVQFNQEAGFKDNVVGNRDSLLSKENPILLIDTKSASFKVPNLKRLHIRFDEKIIYGEDFEFGKQLLAHGERIIFEPGIKVYHTERPTLVEFLHQRFLAGRATKRVELIWPKKLFPQRAGLWWSGRITDFWEFMIKSGYLKKGFVLIPLFFIDKLAYISGKYGETIVFKIKH